MKMVIAGGTGQLGTLVARHVTESGGTVVLLSRTPSSGGPFQMVGWDAQNLGEWASHLDGADVVLNLCGRSVNCRYTNENRRQIMESRTQTTKIIGEAIQQAKRPPALWLQMSTATIYAHRFDQPNTEADGIIGGGESGAPDTWKLALTLQRRGKEAAMSLSCLRLVRSSCVLQW